MARLFVSHSSHDNPAARAIGAWLAEHGYTDVFLDIDPDQGLVPGDRWMDALRAASDRCEAVLCLISPAWLESRWCMTEFLLARSLHKRILAAVVAPVPINLLPAEMTAEWQLCELAGPGSQREMRVAGAIVAFRAEGLDLLRRGLQRAGLDAPSFPWPPPGDPNRAPYRGLRALEAEDAGIFFGRDAAIIRGMDQLRGMADAGVDRLMLVLGASGAGKSSFLRAGLWPLLDRDDAHFLPLPVIRPTEAVISGSAGLAVSLAGAFARYGVARPPGPLKHALMQQGTAFAAILDELAALASARLVHVERPIHKPNLVLPIDQAEELFNAEGAPEAERFLSHLAAALRANPRVLVVATIRTDRYHRLQGEALLPDMRRALFDLPPISPSDYRQVIEGPARRQEHGPHKLAIEPALTERLIADATGADALPLLAFTLERLWADYGGHGRLTLDDYVSMGGVQGAIEAAVEGALARPDQAPAIPAERAAQTAALRAAFIPWLARIDPATRQKLRRPAQLEDIPAGSRAIVDRFVAARLLVADQHAGVDTVEVAHESLLRQWPALVAWLDADAADLAQTDEVERAAAQWDRHGRREEWLDHRADRLDAAEKLLQRQDFRARLGASGAAYIAAAGALAERERASREHALGRQARMQRYVGWALSAVALVLAIGLGSAALQHRANHRMQAQLALRQGALEDAEVGRLADLSALDAERGRLDSSLRIAILAARRGADQRVSQKTQSITMAQLSRILWLVKWRLVLTGHSATVYNAAFSPDGTHIATASGDHTARIWDTATGEQVAVLTGHDDAVLFVAYSPDGRRIVTASRDQTARVWDAASGRQVEVLEGHLALVTAAAFSPDGTRIVTASADQSARVWDAQTGRLITMLEGHADTIDDAAYSPDGTRIVTASEDHTARIWNAATGHQITILKGHTNWVMSAAYSPDGARVATASVDGSVRVWDSGTGQQLAVLSGHSGVVFSAAYSRDGTRIVTASLDETARVWNAATGQTIAVLSGHAGAVISAAFSADGAHIVTASRDQTARVWETSLGKLAVLNGHAEAVMSAAFSGDGNRIVTASTDQTARVWNAATGQQTAVLEGHRGRVLSASFSPDSSRIVTGSDDGTARIWDAAGGHQIGELNARPGSVFTALYSPDGTRIVTAGLSDTARIWDAASGRQIISLEGHTDVVYSASYSPDGKRVVTASEDRSARVWDAATGRQILVLNGHTQRVMFASYSPDGAHIVTASDDQTARVWDAVTGQQTGVLEGQTSAVVSAAYSPDGTRIVTADDHGARIWDTATGGQIAILDGHTAPLQFAAYSPDGNRIVTASEDNTSLIWDVRVTSLSGPQMLTQACAHPIRGFSTLTDAEMTSVQEDNAGPPIDVCAGVAARP